jgi:hypothetical protein
MTFLLLLLLLFFRPHAYSPAGVRTCPIIIIIIIIIIIHRSGVPVVPSRGERAKRRRGLCGGEKKRENSTSIPRRKAAYPFIPLHLRFPGKRKKKNTPSLRYDDLPFRTGFAGVHSATLTLLQLCSSPALLARFSPSSRAPSYPSCHHLLQTEPNRTEPN